MFWNLLMNIIFGTRNDDDESDDTVDDGDEYNEYTIYEHVDLYGIDLLA